MHRYISVRSILGFLLALGMLGSAALFAQQTERAQQQRTEGQARQGVVEGPRASNAPPVFKVEWVRPPSQNGQVPVVQQNIADPNIELKEYGAAAKEFLTSGTPGSESTPFTVWSGACTGPFAVTFRQNAQHIEGRTQHRKKVMEPVIRPSGAEAEELAQYHLQRVGLQVDQKKQ